MKKTIKNILLTFVITFTILSIITYIFNIINYYMIFKSQIYPIINGEITSEIAESEIDFYNHYKYIYGDNSPVTTIAYLQGWANGLSSVQHTQLVTFIASMLLAISIGTIISFSEHSKLKTVLQFIFTGITLIGLGILYISLTSNSITENGLLLVIVEDIISPYFIYYLIFYTALFIIKYFIAKKNAKKLNDTLKD